MAAQNKRFTDTVKKFKDSELKLLQAEEEELLEFRSIIDADLEKAEKIKFKRINNLYHLKNDIDDGLSIVSSLENMTKNRDDFKSLSRISKLSDGLHAFIEDIYKDLDSGSL